MRVLPPVGSSGLTIESGVRLPWPLNSSSTTSLSASPKTRSPRFTGSWPVCWPNCERHRARRQRALHARPAGRRRRSSSRHRPGRGNLPCADAHGIRLEVKTTWTWSPQRVGAGRLLAPMADTVICRRLPGLCQRPCCAKGSPGKGVREDASLGPHHWIFSPTTLEATPSATTYTRTSPVPARLFGIEMFTWSRPTYAATGPA